MHKIQFVDFEMMLWSKYRIMFSDKLWWNNGDMFRYSFHPVAKIRGLTWDSLSK